MNPPLEPPAYVQWRTDPACREEDAARVLGYHLLKHCRSGALATVPRGASSATQAAVEEAVDTALHAVTHLLEGYWKLNAGPGYDVEFSLYVDVHKDGELIESARIPPCRVGLPMGYWAWIEDYLEASK